MKNENPKFERIQFKVADMGAYATSEVQKFIGGQKWNSLMRQFKANPNLMIEVGLHEGKLFDYRGVV
jgi:hypothetical protein